MKEARLIFLQNPVTTLGAFEGCCCRGRRGIRNYFGRISATALKEYLTALWVSGFPRIVGEHASFREVSPANPEVGSERDSTCPASGPSGTGKSLFRPGAIHHFLVAEAGAAVLLAADYLRGPFSGGAGWRRIFGMKRGEEPFPPWLGRRPTVGQDRTWATSISRNAFFFSCYYKHE